MILNLIILLVLFLLFIIYQSILILLSDKKSNFQNIVQVFALIGGCLIFFNIVFNLYIYNSLINTKGLVGPKGIQGLNGKIGKKGECSSTCGQKVCYKLVYDSINAHLKSKNMNNLKNNFLIKKINTICFSDKYTSFLHSENKNKPNEKELIQYIQDTFITWIDIITKFNNGKKFIDTPEYPYNYFDPNTGPFLKIQKYEIWDWGEPYSFKPIIRKQCALDEDLPKINASLELYFTKDYKLIYKNDEIDTIYGPPTCPFNQLGENFTNPRSISDCLMSKNESQKVWKQKEYINFKNNISFYQPDIDKIKQMTNKDFYILGTVWSSDNKNTILNKETIVARDTSNTKDSLKDPLNWNPIWESQTINDSNITNIIIWRPIPPKGWASLGDYVTTDIDIKSKPKNTNFKCVKIELLDSYQLDNVNVWNTSGFKVIKQDRITDKPTELKYPLRTIFPIGITDRNEETLNLGHKKVQSIKLGGYNFFRSSLTNLKSNSPCYVINPKSYTQVKTGDPKTPDDEYGIGWLGGKIRESKYSAYSSDLNLQFFPAGIIEPNIKSSKIIKYYIEGIQSSDASKQNYFILKHDDTDTIKFNYLKNDNTWDKTTSNTNSIINNPVYLWNIEIQNFEINHYLINIKISKDDKDYYLESSAEFNFLENKPKTPLWKLYPSTQIHQSNNPTTTLQN